MEPNETDDARRRRLERLFDRHRRPVLAYALRRVDEPADAADVLAETFLVAWRRVDDAPDGEEALPWLLGVARRVLANQRRGARRRTDLSERLGRELAAQVGVARPPSDGDGARLRAALARLSREDREILLLAGWEELTPAQIGVVLGIRGVAARSRLHRARRRLRTELDRLAASPAGEPAPATPGRAVTAQPSQLDLAKETLR